MTNATTAALIAAVLTLGAAGCGGGAPAPEESASAVPGMGGETQPSLGPGVSEQPDQ